MLCVHAVSIELIFAGEGTIYIQNTHILSFYFQTLSLERVVIKQLLNDYINLIMPGTVWDGKLLVRCGDETPKTFPAVSQNLEHFNTEERGVLCGGNLMTAECKYVRVCFLTSVCSIIIQQKNSGSRSTASVLSGKKKTHNFVSCCLNHFCIQSWVAKDQINQFLMQFAKMRRGFSIVSFSTKYCLWMRVDKPLWQLCLK